MSGVNLIERFVRRLKRIGITVELVMNRPWVYLTHVNGIEVDAKFKSRWGFTIFFVMRGEQWSDRREVFQMIRGALKQQHALDEKVGTKVDRNALKDFQDDDVCVSCQG